MAISEPSLREAIGSIRRRAAEFFDSVDLRFPANVAGSPYAAHRLFYGLHEKQADECLERASALCRSHGVNLTRAESEYDPVVESLLDAICASEPPFSGHECIDETDFLECLPRHYEKKQARDGSLYLVRKTGTIPLVLINAYGIGLAVWSRFLLDLSHDYRIVVVTSRASDVISGSMHGTSSVEEDVAHILDIIQCEHLSAVNVLAWSSAGRTAIRLAGESRLFSSLSLVAITVKQVHDCGIPFMAHESETSQLFRRLEDQPALCDSVSHMFLRAKNAHDWRSYGAEMRGKILFSLPAADRLSTLSRPVADGSTLAYYGKRSLAEESHDVASDLKRLTSPVKLITGQYDQIVNNRRTAAMLQRSSAPKTSSEIRFAGHYPFDLEYWQFRAALDVFLSACGSGRMPMPSFA
jgi:pimeloyl-ACP methyl ester carboxylesterase